jgi:hypothetical protein
MNVGRPLIDAHPIAPPPTVANPNAGLSSAREWRTAKFLQGLPRDIAAETLILETSGEWDGCDVYVNPSIESVKNYGGTPNGIYRFKVYALVEGVGKTLVASSLVSPGHLYDGNNKNILAVQARGARCKYQVTVMYLAIVSPAPENWPVTFSLVASNDLAEADPFVGVSRSSFEVIATTEQALPEACEVAGGTRDPSEWEIVKVTATNTNAAERSLLFFDLGPTGGPGANQIPQLSLSFAPGESRTDHGPFGMRFGHLGLHAGVSSDASKYVAAAAGDIIYQVFLR